MRISLSLKYILFISIILLVVLGVMLNIISRRHNDLVLAQIDMQAKALFKQVLITRRWIADHGGVFVEKLPWVNPNPYLPDSIITDVQGKRYVKENPAMVTKQLSQYAQNEGLYFFHITSLKLMNPQNAPDPFETAALKDFETKNLKEASMVAKIGSNYYYRYIAPLYVEKACLQCHAKQGYKIGDVRGAISVSIPMDYTMTMIASERKYIIGGMAAVGIVLVASLFLITRYVVINPLRNIRRHMACFSHAGNPDIPLIKSGDEIEELSRSFGDMARAIDKYHSCLQEKIRAATRELERKNESLVQASRIKSDFLAKTSHELRTPLTSIKGAMDYLSVKMAMRESDEDQDLLVFFEMIKKNADRLIRLVNNILDYERIELGTFDMSFAPVNLKETFYEVVEAFKPLAREKGVKIRLQTVDASAVVDDDRIRQVLANLLSNALNFSPAGSSITVTLSSGDDFIHAAVADEGSGISEDEQQRIFDQYYTRGTKNGTGLGLAICKSIIEAHGGVIGVENNGSAGSRFWFSIPKQRKETQIGEKTPACHR